MKMYYKDPLAAAYMAREFGVRVCASETFWGEYKNIEDIANDTPNFYIHLDSFNILEPQVGDITQATDFVLNPHMCISEVIEDCDDTRLYPYDAINKHIANNLFNDGGLRIIQRNNKPFFWPEVEE